MTEKILFVDDEVKILEAYRRTLRKTFTVVPAEGGKKALEIMASEGPFPVVISDMQMPEMNGVEFLTKVKQLYPDTIRIMLTGNADQKTAIDAINTSDVFCFLNKPCPPDKMTEQINIALQQYKLQRVETDLLESTVRGSIFALAEVLSMARPEIFGRITRVRSYAIACAKELNLDNIWEIEAAALLSQIGLISLSDNVLQDVLAGETLGTEARSQFNGHPEVAAKLISNIPRMESIAEAIRYQNLSYSREQAPSGDEIPIAARIIRPVNDMLLAMNSEIDPLEIISKLSSTKGKYDPAILEALKAVLAKLAEGCVIEISITQLEEGTILAQDIVTNSGALLIEKGQEVGPSMVARLLNFWGNGEIGERINVIAHDLDAGLANVAGTG